MLQLLFLRSKKLLFKDNMSTNINISTYFDDPYFNINLCFINFIWRTYGIQKLIGNL